MASPTAASSAVPRPASAPFSARQLAATDDQSRASKADAAAKGSSPDSSRAASVGEGARGPSTRAATRDQRPCAARQLAHAVTASVGAAPGAPPGASAAAGTSPPP